MSISDVINTWILTPLEVTGTGKPGLARAKGNLFDLSEEPISGLHKTFSLDEGDANLEQNSGGDTVYSPFSLRLRVAYCWASAENTAGTYTEALLDLYDLAETIEDALTTGPGDAEGVSVRRWRPGRLGGHADWLTLDFDIEITTRRTRS